MGKIVIIGAGLTGLSVAYHLEKQGYFDYKIFEKDATVGGLVDPYTRMGLPLIIPVICCILVTPTFNHLSQTLPAWKILQAFFGALLFILMTPIPIIHFKLTSLAFRHLSLQNV